jgi:hypothetical protein
LKNNGRRDVRHDAEREDRQLAELPAAEHIQEPEKGSRALLDVFFEAM